MRVTRSNYRQSVRRRRGRWSDVGLALTILLFLALVVARFDHFATREVTGAIMVNDGDSLVMNRERIRLRGIDAPEYHQRCDVDGRSYACGAEARRALVDLIGTNEVICRGWERDRYDRLLARCEAAGRDLGEAMVEAGWAVAYGDYAQAEERARGAGRGIWAGRFETPRDYREKMRVAGEAPHDDLLAVVLNVIRQLLGIGGAS
jgi:endonuclease YncB( thermonuclease family)